MTFKMLFAAVPALCLGLGLTFSNPLAPPSGAANPAPSGTANPDPSCAASADSSAAANSSPEAKYAAPAAVITGPAHKFIYVAEEGTHQVTVLDGMTGEKVQKIDLPDAPGAMVLSGDGGKLYVAHEAPQGRIHEVDLLSGEVKRSLAAGHTPADLVLNREGDTLYVCNRFDNTVSALNLASGKITATWPVSREPVALEISADGKLLFVANHLPATPVLGDISAADINVIDVARKTPSVIRLPNGSTGLRGLCLSPDGRHVFVTHILARYHLPTTQLERGWMNTNALSIIDVEKKALLNTVLLDDVDLGASNPWGVACTADGERLVVTHAGSHLLSVLRLPALMEKLAGLDNREAEEVKNNLAFLVGLRKRIALEGNGPRALAVIDDKAYVAEFFSDSLAVVDLKAERLDRTLALGPDLPMTQERRGEMLFNDATLCFQHWQSCASCHPDGRTDGLNWDLLNDGFGNPKNTKSLLLSHKTPPAMATGIRENAEVGVRAGIRFILFSVRPEVDAQAMDAYLKGLTSVPSPHLVQGKLSESAERGRQVFHDAGCGSCHVKPYYTDLNVYDVGLGKRMEKDHAFDTPTLIEVWRTAPYLYDGRTETILKVLSKHNKENRHGRTLDLNPEALEDLAAFVLSL